MVAARAMRQAGRALEDLRRVQAATPALKGAEPSEGRGTGCGQRMRPRRTVKEKGCNGLSIAARKANINLPRQSSPRKRCNDELL